MQFKEAGNFILTKLKQELPAQLFYHSAEHAKDVCQAAELIGQQENLSDHEMQLLLTAACYHDAGFIKCASEHEAESCRIAKATLPDYNFSPEEIDRICGMIMATRLPQTPHNHMEEILADADLDYLGRDDFFNTGHKLYQELVASGTIASPEEWNQLQVTFLEKHHYFTSTSLRLRQAKKEQHLALLKANLNHYHI